MSEVTSVNGKTGAVVLTATDVEAVPTSAEGQPNGVATLNAGGVLSEGQLPSTTVNSSNAPSDNAPTSNSGLWSGGGVGSFMSSPVWGAAHTYRDTNKDGIFYIENFADESGKTSEPTTYTNVFGVRGTKSGPGSLNAYWASFIHKGAGEVGLFIGDASNEAGVAGGNLWGSDFVLTDHVGAQMYGGRVLLEPKAARGEKVGIGWIVSNGSETVELDQALRILGKWKNPIIVYSDQGATQLLNLEKSGNLKIAGSITPVASGGVDVGTTANKWRNCVLASTLYVSASGSPSVGGLSGGIYIGNAGAVPTGNPEKGGVLFSKEGALYWRGASGTETKVANA